MTVGPNKQPLQDSQGKGLTGIESIANGVEDVAKSTGFFEDFGLSKKGWEPAWGPGRHYIGSNLFYYFRSPSGGYVEY